MGASADSFIQKQPSFLERYWRIMVAAGCALVLVLIVFFVLNSGGSTKEVKKPSEEASALKFQGLSDQLAQLKGQISSLTESIKETKDMVNNKAEAYSTKQDTARIEEQLNNLSEKVAALQVQPKNKPQYHKTAAYTVESCSGNLAWLQSHSSNPMMNGRLHVVRVGDEITHYGKVVGIVDHSDTNQNSCVVNFTSSDGKSFSVTLGNKIIG